MAGDHRDDSAFASHRNGFFQARRPGLLEAANDLATGVGTIEDQAPSLRDELTDHIIGYRRRPGGGASLRNCREATVVPGRHPQHQVGEGQVGHQCPVGHKRAQMIAVLGSQIAAISEQPPSVNHVARVRRNRSGRACDHRCMTRDPSDRTADLIRRDATSVWHPFTQQSLWLADEPIMVERAEGIYFWDTDGKRYLDGVSSLWVNVHGHAVPQINDAITAQLQQLDHVTFLGLGHEPGVVLAEKLLATAPAQLTRAFFAGDGSSAVEAAIKMAYQAQAQRGEDRPYFAHIAEGYHGDTLGAVSVGGIDLFHATYRPILLETRMVSSPGVIAQGQTREQRAAEVLAEFDQLLQRDGDRICAVVIEPLVQGAGGMLTHHVTFVSGVRKLCNQYGVLLIADEVATGIGRTGTMWAVDQTGVSPDLMTCGKGLTGGYLPLSAVLATEEIYEAFLGTPEQSRTFFHGHSYTANPICAAAAIANLDLMSERDTVGHAAHIGELLGEALTPLESYEGVKEIRRAGTMTGIEVASIGSRTGFQVCQAAREQGVWVRPLGDVVVLMPPLAISDDQALELVEVVSDAVRTVVT